MAGKQEKPEREPICGMCWAYRRIRAPLEFMPDQGWWRCTICHAVVLHPSEDEEEFRRELLERFRDYHNQLPARSPLARDHWRTIASTRRLRPGGGSRSKRRRKREPKRNRNRSRPWGGVLPRHSVGEKKE